jgi:hypothetical protein
VPDFNDQASEVEQQTLADNLAAQSERAALAPKLAASGICHNHRCAEEFAPGDNRIFCDSKCAAEHARHARK